MPHLLMIGECMIELSQNNELGEYKQSFAGDVFNTGVYIKRCLKDSAQVSFLSVIGEDKMSTQFLNLMAIEQIDSRYLYRCKSNKMGLYIINIDQYGERTFDYWRENSAAKQLMTLIKQDNGNMDFSSVTTLFFSGISIAILSPDDLKDFWKFIERCRSNGCQIVFDPNYRPTLWPSPKHAKDAFEIAYSLSDVVLPGVDDHKSLYNHESAAEIASHLEAKGIGEIIIKNGDLELLISVEGKRTKIDIIPVTEVVDTTSAGDAFNGGYLSARQSGKSVTDAVTYAASVAGCVIQHKGAIVPKTCFDKAITPLM
ncbi:sugar kinase [Thalassotalea psychrophila]|uniref:Sugar kinase n=1 Tax=Thalassotalea psychrophila TaxID=3065647 RepID=A0ABY9TX28_9GAMM|nr:sugar kinase [Colwelliaceae bacterium SQ149]